jgi:hypothetical protein
MVCLAYDAFQFVKRRIIQVLSYQDQGRQMTLLSFFLH